MLMILAIIGLRCSLIRCSYLSLIRFGAFGCQKHLHSLLVGVLLWDLLLIRQMNRVLLFQLVDLGLQLQLVAFLSGNLLLLEILQVQLLILVVKMMSAVIKELDLQSLIQVVLASAGLGRHCAVPSPCLFVDFFKLLLLLNFLSSTLQLSPSVHAACHHRWIIRDSLVLPHIFLMYQMISSRYRVVSVGLNAFDGVLIFKFVLVLHDLENLIIEWHLLLPREETRNPLFFVNFEPWVRSDIFDRVTGIRVSVQNFCQEVGTFC